LVLIRPDGSEGGTHFLQEGTSTVGRAAGELFAADAYLSPKHCSFICTGSKVSVRDEGSLNGIYVRIPAETPISMASGDVMRLGQELVRIEPLPEGKVHDDGTEMMGSVFDEVWGRVSLIVGEDATANAFCLVGDGVVLGRERGDVLFPEDGYVSGTHVRIHRQGDGLIAMDLGSSNGTFFRVNGERELFNGDYILMGQQLFRLDF
jgi:pSer/pThr/pTyr-binding forkhead associated (FHA) protein